MIIDVHAHYIPASLADNEKFSDLFLCKRRYLWKNNVYKKQGA